MQKVLLDMFLYDFEWSGFNVTVLVSALAQEPNRH